MMRQRGVYSPRAIYESDPKVKRILDCFIHDRFSPQEPGLFRWIFDELINRGDRFFHVADLPAYMAINEQHRSGIPESRAVEPQGDPEHGALAEVQQRPHHPGICRRDLGLEEFSAGLGVVFPCRSCMTKESAGGRSSLIREQFQSRRKRTPRVTFPAATLGERRPSLPAP